MQFSAISLPVEENPGGEMCFIKRLDGKTLVALIDGLRFGARSMAAARKAKQLLSNQEDWNLKDMLLFMHNELSKTVGVAVAIVIIDHQKRTANFGGVGNITIKLIGDHIRQITLPKGVLGYQTFVEYGKTVELAANDLVLIHSDGIRDNYNPESMLKLSVKDATLNLVNKYRNPHDHASLVALRDLWVK